MYVLKFFAKCRPLSLGEKQVYFLLLKAVIEDVLPFGPGGPATPLSPG